MQLHDLLAAARRRSRALDEARVVGATDRIGVAVDAVVGDSRAVTPGALFCCVRGATVDGHDFAAAAVDAGASALLVDHELALDVAQVVVADTAAAAGPLASAAAGDPSDRLAVVGVTGTNGKTTVTHLVESIARAAGDAVGIIGTVGTRYSGRVATGVHTTPDACALQVLLADMERTGTRVVAMEVSSHALDQHRVDGTAFTAACFTNLSLDHLDYHGTLDAYAAAKARLFETAFTPRAAINVDDAFGRGLAADAARRGVAVLTFGATMPADVRAESVVSDARGSRFEVVTSIRGAERQSWGVEVPLVGGFNVSNALAAAATAILLGYDLPTIAEGLAATTGVPGRLEPVVCGQHFLVLVDYAHTPDALAGVLAAVRPLADAGGRVIVVFGCGGDRDHGKRAPMGAAAVAGAELVVLTSDNPRSEDPAAIAAEVLGGIAADERDRVVVELDRRRAIATAFAAARTGDVVVIAGKGHETDQIARGATRPFDDRVVASEILAAECA